MVIFHFNQLQHELVWRYFKRFRVLFAQCGYYVGK